MNDRLRNALEALKNLDMSLKPVPLGRQREAALVEGLHGLAEEYGRKISFTCIDANGEMAFNIVGPEGDGPGRPCGQYGEELAAWLSRIPTRTGLAPHRGHVLPENGWCRINHFDVERLLHMVADEMTPSDDQVSNPQESGSALAP